MIGEPRACEHAAKILRTLAHGNRGCGGDRIDLSFFARPAADVPDKLHDFRSEVNHIIVIYQENWSFDGLYGKFPGADGIAKAGAAARQVDKQGVPYKALPQPVDMAGRRQGTNRFPADLPSRPVRSGEICRSRGPHARSDSPLLS